MYPGYRFMDSYPHPRTQMPYAPQHGLSFESVPPRMKVDPAKPPINYESWPYSGSYGFPYPVEYHSCCQHNQFPGYYGPHRPPYPHFTPPPSVSCHGSCPPYPGSYSVQYIPSLHYSMESPQYDKDGSRNPHCCGCPNHSCQQKENRNLKIEERSPENDRSDSLVHSQLKIFPYPIVWVPPGCMMNKDGVKPTELESKEEKANGSLKSLEQQPSVWNGRLPIDLNLLGSLNRGGEGNGIQHRPNEEKKGSSFPLFWMPHKPERVEEIDYKEKDGDKKSNGDPSFFRISPLKLLENQDRERDSEAQEETSDFEAGPKNVGKNVVQKIIPVKQLDQTEQTEKLKDVEEKTTFTPTERKDSAKRQSTPKAEKLHPVCLRVDPLPKQKKSNGSSRSPSPPATNRKSEEVSSYKNLNSSPSSSMQGNKQDTQFPVHKERIKEGEQNKSKTKSIEVIDGTITADNTKESQIQCPVNLVADSQEKVPTNETGYETGKGNGIKRSEVSGDEKRTVGQSRIGEYDTVGTEGASNAKELEVNDTNGSRKLSEDEAAAIIQSAYRGFEVRRWEPLKKLKEIAKIKEQVLEIRSRVEDLVLSSDSWSDDKHQVMIGETIMGLLLKLDTIQGLHPSVREIRKSVSKELVSLQEKLDSLPIKKSEEETYEAKHVEGVSSSSDDACTQNREQEPEDRNDNKINDASHDKAESCQDQSVPARNMILGSIANEKSELMLGDRKTCGALDENFPKPDVPSFLDSNELNSEPLTERKEIQMTSETPILCPPEDHDVLEVEMDKPSLPVVAEEVSNSSAELKDLFSRVDLELVGKDEDMNDSVELPLGVLDQDPEAPESNKGEQIAESGMVSLGGEVAKMNQQEHQQAEVLQSPDVSKLEDNLAPKENIEKDEEYIGEAMHGSEFQKLAKKKNVCSTNESLEACEAEEKVRSSEHMETINSAMPEVKELAAAPETEEDDTREDKKVPAEGTQNGSIDQKITGEEELANLQDSRVSSESTMGSEGKLVEENEKLKEMVEKLIEAGKEQLTAISSLSGRVKDLEKKLSRKNKKLKMRKHKMQVHQDLSV